MNSQHSRQQSSDEQSLSGNPAKRRPDDRPAAQPRTKRNRYISIACNECKRRKIKCNGQTPCHRCGNLALDCTYAPNCCSSGFKDSEEFRHMTDQIQALQDQVSSLYANVNSLRSTDRGVLSNSDQPDTFSRGVSLAPSSSQISYQTSNSPPRPRSRVPTYQGPASSVFNLDVANKSLQTMGITPAEEPVDDGVLMNDGSSYGSPQQRQVRVASMPAQQFRDPLWAVGREGATRLCRVYEDESGSMYPMVDIEKMVSIANTLFTFSESATRTGLIDTLRRLPGPNTIVNDDVNILRMILATALTSEGGGDSELGRDLFESVKGSIQNILWESADTAGLALLVLVAQYHFQRNEEGQAYRIIGCCARISYEMGLHRREVLTKLFPAEEELSWAVKLFWSIYVLDRRWSFGTGKPFVMQDRDIDPLLPEPEGNAYLTAMIAFCRNTSKVWDALREAESTGKEMTNEKISYLVYLVDTWENGLPDFLKYHPSDNAADAKSMRRSLRRLRLILHLRGNQIRTLIHRPIMQSATSIMENRGLAQTAVDIAKDTLTALTALNDTSNIYRTQQAHFNYFLLSALAVLFLAVCHAPAEFSQQVRDEFYMALDLVKGFSTTSHVSKRLWTMIKGLKGVAPKLGLVSQETTVDSGRPYSSAAMGLPIFPGYNFDEYNLNQSGRRGSQVGSSPLTTQQMSFELTNLFETARRYDHGMLNSEGARGLDGFMAPQSGVTQGQEGMVGAFGNHKDFSRV